MIRQIFVLLFLVGELVAVKHELKLVHVLFLHPTEFTFPNYFAVNKTLENVEEDDADLKYTETMTNEEKLAVYNLGVRLRQRYKNFLGDIYSPKKSYTRTTDSDISKISGSLLNAGLWPPAKEQQWLKNFLWQPVPTEYLPKHEDTLLMGRLCPTFIEATNVIRRTTEILKLEEKYGKLFSFIREKTGLEISNSYDIARLYKSLKAQSNRNLTLPEWANGIFPNGEMLNVTYLEDIILSKSNIQKKLNGGYLIQKILFDSMAYTPDLLDGTKKISIYNGDSDLFMGVLNVLGAWYPHVPNVASALIFEYYYNHDNRTYEMKIFHDLGKENSTNLLIIPSCNKTNHKNSTSCNFKNLMLSTVKNLPGNDENLCGHTTSILLHTEIYSLVTEEKLFTLHEKTSDAVTVRSAYSYVIFLLSMILTITIL